MLRPGFSGSGFFTTDAIGMRFCRALLDFYFYYM